MAKRDSLNQWKVQAFMKKMPSCKDLKWISKNFKIQQSEHIFFKTLLEMHEKFLTLNESAPFKTQLRYLLPAAKNFYRQLQSEDEE